MIRQRQVLLYFTIAIVVPLLGISAVKLHAQVKPGGDCECDCGGGSALCYELVCADGTTKLCYRNIKP